MMDNALQKTVKAIGLSSGGLDSILAGVLLKKLGIDVLWACFKTPFFNADHAKMASEKTGIPVLVQDITPIYVEMLKNPKQGYGKNMNPCMDCHTLMYQCAGKLMPQTGAQFLFSGEVLGQRPMSQTRSALNYVEKQSGFQGYILRPLSAKHLPETIPEQNKWVDRDQLLDITGRSRKKQIDLAEQWGITDYPKSGGGCLLTDSKYAQRLKDLFDNGPFHDFRDLYLLQWGRHFRLPKNQKIIVGRNEGDNKKIIHYYRKESDILLKTVDFPGPTTLIPYGCNTTTIAEAASITLAYTKSDTDTVSCLQCTRPDGISEITVKPIARDILKNWIL